MQSTILDSSRSIVWHPLDIHVDILQPSLKIFATFLDRVCEWSGRWEQGGQKFLLRCIAVWGPWALVYSILIIIKCKYKFQVLSNPESRFTWAKERHVAPEPQVAGPWSIACALRQANKRCDLSQDAPLSVTLLAWLSMHELNCSRSVMCESNCRKLPFSIR